VPRTRKLSTTIKADDAQSSVDSMGSFASSLSDGRSLAVETEPAPSSERRRRDRIAPRPATALQDYAASNQGELSLKTGDKVLVLKRLNSRLWHGQIPKGPAGDFPASCVTFDVNVPASVGVSKENRHPEDEATCA